ncbi:MAG: hypothetical protein ACKVQW_15110 [Pyrinomonadaceae bacterium]
MSGHDPFGGKYSGTYDVVGDTFSTHVTVEKTYEEAITIFKDLDYPLKVELSGKYMSPDFFSAAGKVNDVAELVVNCKRIADPVM